MQLAFEYTQQIAEGTSPDLLHFEDNTAKYFYLDSLGNMMAKDTTTPLGAWESREMSSSMSVCEDEGISNFMCSGISRYGAYGCWLIPGEHRFAIYRPMYEVGNYISSGQIKHSIDNPIASLSLTIKNPDQSFINEDKQGFLSPGSKICLAFKAGDSSGYPMGTFYTDSSRFNMLSETVSAEARNTIGKYLKDQSFDENNYYAVQNLKALIDAICNVSGLKSDQYDIADTAITRGMSFAGEMDYKTGLEELLNTVTDWIISEGPDGKIIIGPKTYSSHIQAGTYTFYRDSDIWSREVSRDDASAYSRVCVHDSSNMVKVYAAVRQLEKWGIGTHKTKYVTVPDGTTSADASAYADELAGRMATVGIIETFAGPFRPHLMPGDGAVIINSKGRSKTLGLITEVTHSFGEGGYYTEFTVDSGGSVGKGRLSDYIEKIGGNKTASRAARLY